MRTVPAAQLSLGLVYSLADVTIPTCDHDWSPAGEIRASDGAPMHLRCSRCKGYAGRGDIGRPYKAIRCGLACCFAFATSCARGTGFCPAHQRVAARNAFAKANAYRHAWGARVHELIEPRDIVAAPLVTLAVADRLARSA